MPPLSWQEFRARHSVGDLVEGRVTSVVPFGAFVRVDGYDGLLIGASSVAVGASVSARIAGIDSEKERFSLTTA